LLSKTLVILILLLIFLLNELV